MIDNDFVLQAERMTSRQEEIPKILNLWIEQILKGEWKIKTGKKYYISLIIKIESSE